MTDPPEYPTGDLGSEPTRAAVSSLGSTETIGPYRILQQLGEGGIGEVWLAEQTRPVRRHVALKVIKAGMDTAQVVLRFDAERQALAVMDHPAIAHVFDAGATPQGRPYFVMEYVRGEPITTYCNRHKLTIQARIDLFLHVCEGVQHAHQKGIIHRDLKPSNVLVTLQDDRPVPKIIDFGIAKATTQTLTERTLHTELGAFVGTPEYMSPEQAELTGLDVDTRTDVYSLGVILYQLLTGGLPFGSDTLRDKGLDEIRRTIREVDPPRPSARVTTSAGAPDATAQQRASAPRLAGELRGDLDWITMKALEKDRTRRYGSASDLGADLKRYREDQPVLAGPPSATYRIGKFVRRHRGGVVAACLVVLALAAGLIGTTVGLVRAKRAETVANREAQTAQRVIDLLTGMFEVADPYESRGETITAREVLERGVEEVTTGLDGEPGVKATLLHTAGKVFFSLGLAKRSAELQRQAIDLQRANAQSSPAQLAASLEVLGASQIAIGDFRAAQATLEEALAIRRARDEPLLQEGPLRHLANAHIRQGQLDSARTMLDEYLDQLNRSGHGESPAAGRILNLLANIHTRRNELAEAKAKYERSNEILRPTLRPGDIPVSHNDLAVVYYYLGDYPAAERINREVLGYRRQRFGPDHQLVAFALDNLGEVLFKQGRFQDAVDLHLQALEIEKKALGEAPDMGLTVYNLGLAMQALGHTADAERWLRESMRIRTRFHPDPHPDVAASEAALGKLLAETGRPDAARALLRKAHAAFEKVFGPRHRDTLDAAETLKRLDATSR